MNLEQGGSHSKSLARRTTTALVNPDTVAAELGLKLLNAGPFQLEGRGLDRYGRTLAVVSRSGYSLGAQLVSEGLARNWGDRRGWC